MTQEILTFEDCLKIATTGPKHVLLGNGFSIACRKNIFSYSSLYENAEIDKHSKNLRSLFENLKTTDFEIVMKAIDNSISTLKIYNSKDEDTLKTLSGDYNTLKQLLITTLTKNHPISPNDISDTEYQNCIKFLSNFERIYTLNYDLLLYWTLMKIPEKFQKDDGFRDPFEGDPKEYFEEDYVSWVNNTHSQLIFYLHGALHLFMSEYELKKFSWRRTGAKLIDQIDSALKEGKFPLVVSESESNMKMAKIQRSNYLGHALRSFQFIGGNLFIYGHSLADNDQHILNQIAKNKTFKNVFISIYGNPESPENKLIISKGLNLKYYKGKESKKDIYFYDASSVKVW